MGLTIVLGEKKPMNTQKVFSLNPVAFLCCFLREDLSPGEVERLLLPAVAAAFEGITFCGSYVLVPMLILQVSLICHQASGSPFAEAVVYVLSVRRPPPFKKGFAFEARWEEVKLFLLAEVPCAQFLVLKWSWWNSPASQQAWCSW